MYYGMRPSRVRRGKSGPLAAAVSARTQANSIMSLMLCVSAPRIMALRALLIGGCVQRGGGHDDELTADTLDSLTELRGGCRALELPLKPAIVKVSSRLGSVMSNHSVTPIRFCCGPEASTDEGSLPSGKWPKTWGLT